MLTTKISKSEQNVMSFVPHRTCYTTIKIALISLLCLMNHQVLAQSQSGGDGGDLVPKTKVNNNVKPPPVKGAQYPPLRMTPDKPEIINLDKPAMNIVVPNEQHAIIRPDTRRTLIVQPRQPGSTFFRALDKDGNIIMQRYIIVGAPKNGYVRVHRSCGPEAESCDQESMYYCPGRCYTLNVVQPNSSSSSRDTTDTGGSAAGGSIPQSLNQ